MRRVAWVVLAFLLIAGCGGDDGSVFQTGAGPASSTQPGDPATTTSTSSPDEPGSGDEPSFAIPDESTVIETAAWGEAFDRRIVVRVADDAGSAAATEVAAALGGTVVASIGEFLIFEIELPEGGEAAIAAALATAAARDDVLIAAPSEVVRPDREVVDRPCGPLDAPVLQAEGQGDQYRLIGVEDAWRLVKASGVETTPPTVGFADGFGQSVGYHGQWVNEVVDASPDRDAPGVLDAILPEDAFTWERVEVFASSTITSEANTFDGVRNLVERGAKVINLSLGVNDASPETIALYRTFLRDLATSHPDVLIVASAGNSAADVSTHVPGGLNEPNLVTVGGLDHQGDRWQETWTDAAGVEHTAGSNYVSGGDGEVTLAVTAQDVFTGMNADGEPMVQSGTSFAAPQVTAAVAVLQALDPTLSAAEIKQILIDTAATEIADPAVSDRVKAVDPAVGGRVLRIDNAVWKVLSERLGVEGTREEVVGRATLRANARQTENDPLTYRIVATAPGGGDTTTVQIAVNGPGILNPGSESLTTTSDVARWRWTFFNFADSAQATLTRNDTGACARLVVTADESSTYAGTYQGSFDLFTFEGQSWRPIVEFTLTVDQGLQAIGEGGVTSTQVATGGSRYIDTTFHCEGTVDDAGALICAGSTSWDILLTYSDGTTSGDSDSGPMSLDLTIGADGSLTGSATDGWGTAPRPIQGQAVSGGPAGLP